MSNHLTTDRARQNADTLTALLGFCLVTERRRRGLTQTHLANILTTDQTTVSRWETGVSIPCGTHLLNLRTWHREADEVAA